MIDRIAFSSDQTRIATASRPMTRSVSRDARPARSWANRPSDVSPSSDIEYQPIGTLFASAGDTSNLLLWDAGNLQELVRRPLTTRSLSSVGFSADGKTLATGGLDVVLWDTDFESWIDKARAVANRNLSQVEWNSYRRHHSLSSHVFGF